MINGTPYNELYKSYEEDMYVFMLAQRENTSAVSVFAKN